MVPILGASPDDHSSLRWFFALPDAIPIATPDRVRAVENLPRKGVNSLFNCISFGSNYNPKSG